MTDRTVLFHVGYHKTGTTWLQGRLFVPGFGYAPLLEHRQVWDHIVAPHTLDFDPEPARRLIRAALAAQAEGAGVPVISSEILCGLPYRGGRESAECARRIKAIWPDARVLLTIRAQVPAIAATYMQYLRRGGTRSPRRFLGHQTSPGYDAFDPAHFRYDRLVSHYQALFGAGNVQVMTHEQLVADPARFTADLAAWSGARHTGQTPDTARIGVSDPESVQALLRLANHFRFDDGGDAPLVDLGRAGLGAYRLVSWLFRRPALRRLLGRRRPATRMAQALFGGSFAASNRRLLEICAPGLDLPGYEG